MLTSSRGLVAASLAATSLFLATPALAEDAPAAEESAVTVSANVAITSDYRFRGVSLSGGDMAIQGGIDLSHESGFYAGTWASSIDDGGTDVYGDLELDLFGGWTGEVASGLTADVGLVYYLYPTKSLDADTDYFESHASLAYALGPVETTVGVAYSWDQDSLGGDDNLYLSTDLSTDIPSTPVSLSAHLGYTDGVFAPTLLAGTDDESGLDWSLGASASLGILEFGVSYVGVEGPSIDGFTDDTVVATLTASF